jgi:hypothetical protein
MSSLPVLNHLLQFETKQPGAPIGPVSSRKLHDYFAIQAKPIEYGQCRMRTPALGRAAISTVPAAGGEPQ